MEEIKIELEVLTERRNERQCEIAEFFNCRFPTDVEFCKIGKLCDAIFTLEERIDVCQTLLDTIKSNR